MVGLRVKFPLLMNSKCEMIIIIWGGFLAWNSILYLLALFKKCNFVGVTIDYMGLAFFIYKFFSLCVDSHFQYWNKFALPDAADRRSSQGGTRWGWKVCHQFRHSTSFKVIIFLQVATKHCCAGLMKNCSKILMNKNYFQVNNR